MLHQILPYIWLGWPTVAFIVNRYLPKRLGPVGLYFSVTFIGYAILLFSVWALDAHLRAEMYKYDLNGDGSFSESETTPEAEVAMERFTSDTGRTFAPMFGVPVTGAWVLTCLLTLYCSEWIVLRIFKPREQEVLHLPQTHERDTTEAQENPYKPPNTRIGKR